MANLKDLLVNGPSNLIGDVTVNKIRLTSLEIPTSSNGTKYDTGSNGKILKSNGTSVYWANDNNTKSFTITANATDGLWDLTGTNGTNSVTYALAPYSSKQTTASFYTGTTAPSLSTRLNYDGYLYAKKLYSDGAETITKNGGIINNSLTLQKSSTSPDSPELIFNGQAGNSNAYKWSIQKNSSGDLIFSKINSNNTSTTTIVFSADGYLLPNTTDTYDLGSNNKKWANVYAINFKGNADTATTLSSTLSINKGGTGNSAFSANTLIYTSNAATLSSGNGLYTTGSNLAINKTSITNGFSFEVNGDSLFHDDVSIEGNLDVTWDTHLWGNLLTSEEVNLEYKLKTIDSIAQITDTTNNITTSENEYHIYTLAPKQIVTSWNNSNNSKYIEISLPSGINQTTIGFWIDFYSSTGIGSFCCYGEIPASNGEWKNCQVFSLGNVTITQFPVQFCRHNNQYKIIIGDGTYDIVSSINNKNFIIRDVVTYNTNPLGYDLFSNLEISSQLLSAFPTENISIDQCFYSSSIGDTPDYIYRITAINRDYQLGIFSNQTPFYYFDRNGNNICRANSNYYEYEKFGSLIQDREYLIKFRVINSSSGRINITHTFNLQNNEIYTLPYDSSNGNSIGFTSTGFYSQAVISNYYLHKGETVEISCTAI